MFVGKNKMPSHTTRLLRSTCLSIITVSAFVSFTAQAGFEWTPPEDQKSSTLEEITRPLPPVISHTTVPETTQSAPAPAPMEKESPEIIEEPAPMAKAIENAETPPQKTQDLSINPFPLEGKEDTNVSDTTSVVPELEDAMPIEAAPAENNVEYAVIQGFGTEMPLALALTQIVPAEFAYSFGDDINAGTRISWQGGKPWDVVLQEALNPLNIKVHIVSNTVVLKTKMDEEASLQQDNKAQKTAFIPEEANTVEEILDAEKEPTPNENQIVVLDPDVIEEDAEEEIVEIAATEKTDAVENAVEVAEDTESAKLSIERKNIEPVPIRDNIKGLEEEKKIAKSVPKEKAPLKKKLLLRSIISA